MLLENVASRPGMATERGWIMHFIDLEAASACVCAGRLRGQEFENRFLRGRGLIGREQMAGMFEQDELCAGNARRDQFRICGRDQPVGLPVNDERWRRDLRQAAE